MLAKLCPEYKTQEKELKKFLPVVALSDFNPVGQIESN